MQVKQFLIELQYGESTRFLFDDRNLADHICAIASDAGRWQTEGPRPMATVYQIEQPAEAAKGKLIAVVLKEGISK